MDLFKYANYDWLEACPICGMDLIPAELGNWFKSDEFKLSENATALANIQPLLLLEVNLKI